MPKTCRTARVGCRVGRKVPIWLKIGRIGRVRNVPVRHGVAVLRNYGRKANRLDCFMHDCRCLRWTSARIDISPTGVGSLVGAWFALSNGNQHIILIGRTGRIASSNSMMSSLQSYEAHYLTMSRCDVATIEEAHMLKAMNSSMPLNGLIHASTCQPSSHFATITAENLCPQ